MSQESRSLTSTFERCKHDKENPYLMVSNDLIRDSNISPNCRWLIIYLLANKDGWVINIKEVLENVKGLIGINKLYSIVKEAIDAGYVKREEIKNGNIRVGVKYFVSERPKFKSSEGELKKSLRNRYAREHGDGDINKDQSYKETPIIITEDDPPPEIAVPPEIPIPAGGNNKSSTKEDLSTFPPCLEKCTDLSPLQKRQLLKYSPATLAKAVEYTYHTSTKLKGPQARIKQLHAFCQNPEAYEDSYRRLNEPDRGKSIKEKILSSFKNGEKYNNYYFHCDDVGINLQPISGHGYHTLNWKEPNFAEKWLELLTKLKIKT